MNKINSQCGKYIYHICIIDYLQLYNYKKKGETFWKTHVNGINPYHVSSIKPETYGKRFLCYIKN